MKYHDVLDSNLLVLYCIKVRNKVRYIIVSWKKLDEWGSVASYTRSAAGS